MTKHFHDWDPPAVKLLYMADNGQSFLHGERRAGVRGELQQVWVTSDGLEWTITPIERCREQHRHGDWKRWSTADWPIMPPGFLYSRMSATEVVWWRTCYVRRMRS